jgi:hypothetical protein
MKKSLQPTSIITFDESLLYNAEVNNISNNVSVILVSVELLPLTDFIKRVWKTRTPDFADEVAIVIQILFNEKWEIGLSTGLSIGLSTQLLFYMNIYLYNRS